MSLTSFTYLAFTALLILPYYLAPRRARPYILAAASAGFILFSGLVCLISACVTAVTGWLAGRLIEALPEGRKKPLLAAAVALALVPLGAARLRGGAFSVPGVSYYTLGVIGYLIEVYRGSIRAERSPWRFLLFVTFFPQLTQGPVSRYDKVRETLFSGADFDRSALLRGAERILWGFFKKLVVADRLSSAVSAVTGGGLGGGYVLAAAILYTLELYADFTGGIDIALGTAELFGVKLAENFRRPFLSSSLAEYWRRWHISLAGWFRDYVFYPLSASRPVARLARFAGGRFGGGVGRRAPLYLSSLAVWLLTGLWHGLTLNYAMWGLLNWAVLMVSGELERRRRKSRRAENRRTLPIFGTFALVAIMNLFDCYGTLGGTLSALASLFIPSAWGDFSIARLGLSAADWVAAALGLAIILAAGLLSGKGGVRERLAKKPFPLRFAAWFALFLVTLIMGQYGAGYDASQFIYNRF